METEITAADARALLDFAIEVLADDGELCEQGLGAGVEGRGGRHCKNAATHEHRFGGYVMCVECAETWWSDDEDDPEVIAAGLADGSMRAAASGGYEYRMATRRRDAPDAEQKLSTARVEAMLLVQRRAAA